MKRRIAIGLLSIIIVMLISQYAIIFAAGGNDPAPGTNNDNVRPKIRNMEIGSNEYVSSSNHIHDIHSPFDIYVWIDGYNELDDLSIDWNDVQVYLTWSYITEAGTSYGPFSYELLSPTTVGGFKRYHFPIPDQDGDMDIFHQGITTYYPYEGDTKASFGAGTVNFYVYTQLISDSSIRCYYQYPAEQFTSSNQMHLLFAPDPTTSGEPVEPQTPPQEVGLEDIPIVGEIIEDLVKFGITDNPIIVTAVILGIGGFIGLLMIRNRLQKTKKSTKDSKRYSKSKSKSSSTVFSKIFSPPQPTINRRHSTCNKRKKKRRRKNA